MICVLLAAPRRGVRVPLSKYAEGRTLRTLTKLLHEKVHAAQRHLNKLIVVIHPEYFNRVVYPRRFNRIVYPRRFDRTARIYTFSTGGEHIIITKS